jgi:trigger factor
MKTELIEVSPTRKEIKVEIEQDAVRAAYDRISDLYAKQVNVPGFRRGHAPRSVVRTRFRDEIRGEVLRELVPAAINDAIREHTLQVIGEPDVQLDNAESLHKLGTDAIKVRVNVEVLPEVALGEYKNLELTRRLRAVTDEDVSRVLEGLRESSATLQPVEDRPAQIGDTVTVNFNGKFVEPEEKHEHEDINVEEVDVELGGEGVQQAFTDNLIGARPDDEKKFTVTYPEDFTSRGLAGKTVDYTARVLAVRIKDVPEMDDEWAQSLGEEYDSLATLRAKVREDLEKRALDESNNRLRADAMHKLIAAHEIEVPDTLLQHQTNQLLEAAVRDMLRRGIDPRRQELNWEGARRELGEQAAQDIRGSLLLERIADEEKLEPSDEEINAEIELIARAAKQTPDEVRAALTKQGGATSIADRLRNRKALDLIIDNARITDEEWREEPFAENAAQTDSSSEAERETDANGQGRAKASTHNAATAAASAEKTSSEI